MQVLLATLDDLFQFAVRSVFGFTDLAHKRPFRDVTSGVMQPLLPLLPASKQYVQHKDEVVSAHGSYFIGLAKSSVHIDPVYTFDNVFTELNYGTQVTVLKFGGRWAMIQVRDVTGWILKDQISSRAEDIYPSFLAGAAYDSSNETTERVRDFLADEFSCRQAGLPLTGAEYVSYRLLRNQRKLRWPDKRPRTPGSWQTVLRGQPDVHLGIVPKTGAVMEIIIDDEGYLLYVEAVFPDESIQVSSVDHAGAGIYTEEVLPKSAWLEMRPVFIEAL